MTTINPDVKVKTELNWRNPFVSGGHGGNSYSAVLVVSAANTPVTIRQALCQAPRDPYNCPAKWAILILSFFVEEETGAKMYWATYWSHTPNEWQSWNGCMKSDCLGRAEEEIDDSLFYRGVMESDGPEPVKASAWVEVGPKPRNGLSPSFSNVFS